MEGQSGLSELSNISWVSTVEECLLSGVPLYIPVYNILSCDCWIKLVQMTVNLLLPCEWSCSIVLSLSCEKTHKPLSAGCFAYVN